MVSSYESYLSCHYTAFPHVLLIVAKLHFSLYYNSAGLGLIYSHTRVKMHDMLPLQEPLSLFHLVVVNVHGIIAKRKSKTLLSIKNVFKIQNFEMFRKV